MPRQNITNKRLTETNIDEVFHTAQQSEHAQWEPLPTELKLEIFKQLPTFDLVAASKTTKTNLALAIIVLSSRRDEESIKQQNKILYKALTSTTFFETMRQELLVYFDENPERLIKLFDPTNKFLPNTLSDQLQLQLFYCHGITTLLTLKSVTIVSDKSFVINKLLRLSLEAPLHSPKKTVADHLLAKLAPYFSKELSNEVMIFFLETIYTVDVPAGADISSRGNSVIHTVSAALHVNLEHLITGAVRNRSISGKSKRIYLLMTLLDTADDYHREKLVIALNKINTNHLHQLVTELTESGYIKHLINLCQLLPALIDTTTSALAKLASQYKDQFTKEILSQENIHQQGLNAIIASLDTRFVTQYSQLQMLKALQERPPASMSDELLDILITLSITHCAANIRLQACNVLVTHEHLLSMEQYKTLLTKLTQYLEGTYRALNKGGPCLPKANPDRTPAVVFKDLYINKLSGVLQLLTLLKRSLNQYGFHPLEHSFMYQLLMKSPEHDPIEKLIQALCKITERSLEQLCSQTLVSLIPRLSTRQQQYVAKKLAQQWADNLYRPNASYVVRKRTAQLIQVLSPATAKQLFVQIIRLTGEINSDVYHFLAEVILKLPTNLSLTYYEYFCDLTETAEGEQAFSVAVAYYKLVESEQNGSHSEQFVRIQQIMSQTLLLIATTRHCEIQNHTSSLSRLSPSLCASCAPLVDKLLNHVTSTYLTNINFQHSRQLLNHMTQLLVRLLAASPKDRQQHIFQRIKKEFHHDRNEGTQIWRYLLQQIAIRSPHVINNQIFNSDQIINTESCQFMTKTMHLLSVEYQKSLLTKLLSLPAQLNSHQLTLVKRICPLVGNLPDNTAEPFVLFYLNQLTAGDTTEPGNVRSVLYFVLKAHTAEQHDYVVDWLMAHDITTSSILTIELIIRALGFIPPFLSANLLYSLKKDPFNTNYELALVLATTLIFKFNLSLPQDQQPQDIWTPTFVVETSNRTHKQKFQCQLSTLIRLPPTCPTIVVDVIKLLLATAIHSYQNVPTTTIINCTENFSAILQFKILTQLNIALHGQSYYGCMLACELLAHFKPHRSLIDQLPLNQLGKLGSLATKTKDRIVILRSIIHLAPMQTQVADKTYTILVRSKRHFDPEIRESATAALAQIDAKHVASRSDNINRLFERRSSSIQTSEHRFSSHIMPPF